MVHFIGLYNYYISEIVEGGSNANIEVLRRTLLKLEAEGKLQAKV